jgi:predicted PurR-regulated permease PerM
MAEDFSVRSRKSSFSGHDYGDNPRMRETARKAFVAALVVGGVVVLGLALWKLRVVIALLFLAFIIAAAMRPSVEWLRRYRVPRGIGILAHYVALVAGIGLLIWFVVPSAIEQIQEAVPTTSELRAEARESSGIKQRVLLSLEQRLEEVRVEDLPSATELLNRATEITIAAFEIAVGIIFTLACAAYWIFERDRAMGLVLSLVPRERRRVIRDTWDLIDLKLGAYVRGQLLLVVLVALVLSIAFWIIGLPFWLLIGVFAGIVELIPVIGPLAAGAVAVGVGFTESWQTALAAGLIVLIVRLVEDYTVIPRVLGGAVGLTPLTVLVAVSAVAILFGAMTVLLAIPFAAVLATLVDVVVRKKTPAEEDVPAVLFPAKEAETSER